jgi:uncharacterized protein (TIGR00645 family)
MNRRASRLLTTFVKADRLSEKTLFWQATIHVAFLLSALAIGRTERLTRQQAH